MATEATEQLGLAGISADWWSIFNFTSVEGETKKKDRQGRSTGDRHSRVRETPEEETDDSEIKNFRREPSTTWTRGSNACLPGPRMRKKL